MRIQHLLRDTAGLERAVERGFRYYHTRCGTTALLAQLRPLSDRKAVDCGACLALAEADETTGRSSPGPAVEATRPVPGAMPEGEVADLSDFDALEDLDLGPVDDAHPTVRTSGILESPSSSSGRATRAPYPEPDEPSMADICRRLGMDPSTDPEGRLGNLEGTDVRSVLTVAERQAAGMVLGLVGGIPMAAPLVRTVYRLCHRLAWYESADDGGPSAAEE